MEVPAPRQPWAPPKIVQLPMVDTTVKGSDMSEDTKTNMFMTATGMAS